MNLKLRFRLFLAILWMVLIEPFLRLARLNRPRGLALANEMGLTFAHGRESLQVDPAASLPVSAKFLVYIRGSTQYYAKPSDGGATLASLPLGISPDSAYQAGDFITVDRFGARPGTMLGTSAGAVAIDHLVYAAANGLVGDLATAANGTYWIIGRATKTVAIANAEITFVPVSIPYLLTNTAGTFTNPVNPL